MGSRCWHIRIWILGPLLLHSVILRFILSLFRLFHQDEYNNTKFNFPFMYLLFPLWEYLLKVWSLFRPFSGCLEIEFWAKLTLSLACWRFQDSEVVVKVECRLVHLKFLNKYGALLFYKRPSDFLRQFYIKDPNTSCLLPQIMRLVQRLGS